MVRHLDRVLLALLLIVSFSATGVRAEGDFSDVEIVTTRIGEGLHLLVGRGGNIAVVSGKDGVALVDDQFAPLEQKIRDAVAAIDSRPIRFVVNTHWHWDHTGGNEGFAGGGAQIVAHENVRARMSSPQRLDLFDTDVEPSPAAALPVMTFTRDAALHLNGMTLRIEHRPGAHTDGDAIVWFEGRDAVHMGDIFFTGRYPFVDTATGGSVAGVIDAVTSVIERIADDAVVIPGHGALSDRQGLADYRDMLTRVRDRVAAAIADGKGEDEVVAASPSAEFDAAYGGGSIKADLFVRMIYRDLVASVADAS